MWLVKAKGVIWVGKIRIIFWKISFLCYFRQAEKLAEIYFFPSPLASPPLSSSSLCSVRDFHFHVEWCLCFPLSPRLCFWIDHSEKLVQTNNLVESSLLTFISSSFSTCSEWEMCNVSNNSFLCWYILVFRDREMSIKHKRVKFTQTEFTIDVRGQILEF